MACCPDNKYLLEIEWKAWDEIMMGKYYGPGNSKANLLFWAASRSNFTNATTLKQVQKVNYNQTIQSTCTHNSACDARGLTGDCCPTMGKQSLMLGCCPTVQYPLASF